MKLNEKSHFHENNNQHLDVVDKDLDELDTSSQVTKKRKCCCLQ